MLKNVKKYVKIINIINYLTFFYQFKTIINKTIE